MERDSDYDVIVIGGGAAGLMCAISAGQRGRRVLVLEKAKRIGKKILMSGGGRCNFTNLNATAENFISSNPHFCKSALARYTPQDFLALVERHHIAWHEKGPGQLFCDFSSKQIVAMLAGECSQARVEIRTSCDIHDVNRVGSYTLHTSLGTFHAPALVIASGGLSIPKMGASDFGYRLARQFGLPVLPLRAGLVPFTLDETDLAHWSRLSGVSALVSARTEKAQFLENMLFTHRGVSGPSMLQLSSYWREGEPVHINLLPGQNVGQWLSAQREQRPRMSLINVLARTLNKAVASLLCNYYLMPGVPADTTMAELTRAQMEHIQKQLEALVIYPSGTEGYRTAEVTLGGIDTDAISSKTMETREIPGLYFVGEVVDVTGQLGGYNFQWAWASGWCAGQAL